MKPATPRQPTKAQQLAIQLTDKNVLVSAGAGTGKTHVLVERFLHLITEGRAIVSEILTLTYTEKAANEMKGRILERLEVLGLEQERRALEGAYISTIHAFAARILKEHPLESGVDPHFRVVHEEEADFLVEQALDQALDALCAPGNDEGFISPRTFPCWFNEKPAGNDVFQLLKTYGEPKIRQGLRRLLEVSRHEGRTLSEFFQVSRERLAAHQPESILPLLEQLDAKEEAEAFRRYAARTNWGWPLIQEFQEWCRHFSKRGGKKNKDDWKKIKQGCDAWLSAKLEPLAEAWRATLEPLALAFEQHYERLKAERGFLDFDDLQMKAVRLFRGEDPLRRRLREHYRRHFRYLMIDEFQDTNPLQLELIELLASGENLFLVGDYKQSIYRFRGAEADLFLAKKENWQKTKEGVCIEMMENFRTAEPVLSFINQFFEILWQEDGFAFDGLLPKVETLPIAGTEILLVEREEDEDLDLARMREAEQMADRLQELNGEGVAFGDMAVLFSAMRDIGLYENALKQRGIPYFAVSGRGFYHQSEIQDVLQYLAFLNNPMADIPLAAVLRSPLFQLRDPTLFWLARDAKKNDDKAPLWEGVRRFEQIPEIEAAEKEKLVFFLRVSEALLAERDHLYLTELLDLILERTGYELNVLSDPQGVRRYANLKKLIQLARDLESYEPLAISSFLQTVRRLQTQEARESEAQIEAEASGTVVRLMTIHAAKGLEFSVVVIADMGREFRSFESEAILAEPGAGYGVVIPHPDEPDDPMQRPWSWQRVEIYSRRKALEERKRLLYVAMTRAQQRLILSGIHTPEKKEKEGFRDRACWMDWVMAVELGVMVRTAGPLQPRRRPLALAEKKSGLSVFENLEPVAPEKLIPDAAARESVQQEADRIWARLHDERPPQPSRVIDLPVSAFASYHQSPGQYAQVYEMGYREKTMEEAVEADPAAEEEMDQATFGTAMHSLLERLDFHDPARHRQALLETCFAAFPEARRREAAGILEQFLASELFHELAKARVIRREIPFLLNERHGIVHGVIDVLFQDTRGHWHILDYKTAVGDQNKLEKSGYQVQIVLYAHAVQEILKVSPHSGILYFLKNGWSHREALGPEKMRAIAAQVKQWQEAILNYRNQFYKKI